MPKGIGTYQGTEHEVEHVCFVEFVDQILFHFTFLKLVFLSNPADSNFCSSVLESVIGVSLSEER